MAQEPDVIRQQIEDTRSSLTDKIETLESEVRTTVLNAKETVEDTIENVKGTVEETLESVKETVHGTVNTVKETFDLRRQVDRHPWAMMGGSLVAGFIAGRLFERDHHIYHWGRDRWVNRMAEASPPVAAPRSDGRYTASERPATPAAAAAEPSWTDTLRSQFREEINLVKGLAIGAAMGVARDLIKQSLPQLSPQVDDVMNRVTSKLGGEPIHRPLVDSGARCP